MLSVPARRRAPDGAATAAHPDARAVEVVARLDLADHDLARRTLAVRRGEHTHVVHLDDLSTALMADWPRERRRHWPQATDPHLLITSQSYRHPASPQISYCAMRAAFDQIGLLPRQVRADRILDKAQATADPVHLVRIFGIFGIHPSIAVKYVHAAHTRTMPCSGSADRAAPPSPMTHGGRRRPCLQSGPRRLRCSPHPLPIPHSRRIRRRSPSGTATEHSWAGGPATGC